VLTEMTHFVDTSGLLAILSSDDRFHPEAFRAWTGWVAEDVPLVTSTTCLSRPRPSFRGAWASMP
jgi:predicted nucleic acid-binding protein